jgi:hypothetical protein
MSWTKEQLNNEKLTRSIKDFFTKNKSNQKMKLNLNFKIEDEEVRKKMGSVFLNNGTE